jgi:hypothetical protein
MGSCAIPFGCLREKDVRMAGTPLAPPVALPLPDPARAAWRRQHRYQRLAVYLAPVFVLLLALGQAVFCYAHFRQYARQLWGGGGHDRNAHYWLGLRFGLDLRHGDVVNLVRDLHSARFWPPLHGLLVGLVQAVGGCDYRLAVLPSLAAWVAAAVFAFLLARRACVRGGDEAGWVAALFVLASPAHRAFATDIMLESLGAALSLAVLYFYLASVQDSAAWPGRGLGLMLTALCLTKYNYWVLVILALAAAEIGRGCDFRQWLQWAIAFPWRAWAIRQLRQPLNYPLALVMIPLAAGRVLHVEAVTLGGRRFLLYPANNLVWVAYLLVLLRGFAWWRGSGRQRVAQLGLRGRQLVAWHVVPVMLWFLWPQKIGSCLEYLTRNHGGDAQGGLMERLGFYANCLAVDYQTGTVSAVLTLGLAAVAAVSWRRLRPGTSALFLFVLLSAGLCISFTRSRFLHSWVAACWVLAGAGLAQLIYGNRARSWDRIRPWLAAAAVAALAALQLPGLLQAGHAPEGGPQRGNSSLLDLTDRYLPALDTAQQAAILSPLPDEVFYRWTWSERLHQRKDLQADLWQSERPAAENQAAFAAWLQSTTCDTLVHVDLAPGSPYHGALPSFERLRDLLAAQSRFTCAEQHDVPDLGFRVGIWNRRSEPVAGSAAPHQSLDAENSYQSPKR